MLTVPTHQKASFSPLPHRIKMGGRNKTRECRSVFNSQLLQTEHPVTTTLGSAPLRTTSMSLFHVPHEATCTSHCGLRALSGLPTTSPPVPYLSTQVFPSQGQASHALILISIQQTKNQPKRLSPL